MKIKRFNPENAIFREGVFYIQSHGFNAGKPLKKPIPNSWQIETNHENDFEICFALFNSKILQNSLRGSVIPFLPLRDYKKILHPLLTHHERNNDELTKKLSSIQKIDSALLEMEERKKLYLQLKTCLASQIIIKLKTP